MNKRGQGALEFLTTYGWAFLVVLVMVGALAQLGIFDRFGGSRCVSSQGFLCSGSEVNDASQKFKFKNTLGEDVAISNASATIRSSGEVIDCDVPSGTVSDGSSFEVSCQGTGLTSGKRENLDVKFNYYPATSTEAYAKSVYADVSEFVEDYEEFDQVTTGGERTASSCGIVFEAGKTFKLNNSVTSGTTCFTIDKAGVTLDCQDYSITGSGAGYGVNVQANNVVIKNCNITGFNTGVRVSGNLNGVVIDNNYFNQSSGSSGYNIYFESSVSGSVVKNNIIRGNTAGIFISTSSDSLVENNDLNQDGNLYSVYLVRGSSCIIRNNIIRGNPSRGLELYYPLNCLVENNDVDLSLIDKYGVGINSYYSIGTTFLNNNVVLRAQSIQRGDAFSVYDAKTTIIQDNVVDSYDRVACTFATNYYVSASVPGITATGNKCTAYTGFPGLWLNGALKYSTISNNEFKGLGGLGAQIGNDLTGTTFSNNIFRGNNFGALTFHPAAYYGTFTDNTIEGYGGVPAIFTYSTNANHHNTFSGNTLSAASGIFVISMNSQSYANSFINNEITGSKWVTNGNVQNTFNDATRGNKYYLLNGNPASSVLNFVDANADGWADSGTNVPLSSSTASTYWTGSGSDAHPSMN